jgi:hypothetical protein
VEVDPGQRRVDLEVVRKEDRVRAEA